MNYKRAILFGIMVYVSSFIAYGFNYVIPYLQTDTLSLRHFVFGWVWNIPVLLLFSKWFFKKVPANLTHGFLLGCMCLLTAFALDGFFIFLAVLANQSLDQFKELYGSWLFYVTLLEVVALTTFAGWEFDKTYTKR
ncbi:MAG: hypothetical protein KBD15_02630 [Candidatus Magasanikbacteria bacterium]|jgi:uncharacterized membrane protein (DUF485 family)|nr:hypothetical protein [Candidatus Magasanikbacteria bacterium]